MNFFIRIFLYEYFYTNIFIRILYDYADAVTGSTKALPAFAK